jgi:Uma2 family endonuclease
MTAPIPTAKRPRRTTPALASRLTRPMPGPGESALVGMADWSMYERLTEQLPDSGLRIRYFHGLLELMSLSFEHESLSAHIGRLVEIFCMENGLDYQVWGSTTQRKEGQAGGEPDESYSFGSGKKTQPELIIEVALSSGGIDKLEFWATFGAKEVWIWQNNRLHGFAREKGRPFEPIMESRLLPGLKLEWIQECAVMEPTSRAVKSFREKLPA